MLIISCLTSCATPPEEWVPVVDVANDPHADRLDTDITQCRALAIQVGSGEWSSRTHTPQWTADGTLINRSAFHHAFSTCLTKRHHPVLDLGN